MKYCTFLRSCTNFPEYSSAPKLVQATGLTIGEARQQCTEFNDNRTPAEIEAGTKMEFESE